MTVPSAAPTPTAARPRRLLRALSAAAALLAAPAAAEGPSHVVLPIAAPDGAHPLLADFVAICSRAMLDQPSAIAEAGRRGWVSTPDGDGILAEAARAALGSFSLTKESGDGLDSVFLLVNRVDFPHIAATSCNLQTLGTVPAGFDPAVLSRIEGVLGGGLYAMIDPKGGGWSLVDEQDQVVTILSVPLGGRGISLSMNRAVRVDPPPAPPGKPAP